MRLSIIPFVLFFIALCSCRPEQKPATVEKKLQPASSEMREQLVGVNQQLARKENDILESYVRSHRMPFISTPSGIRYYVYKHSDAGDSVRTGMEITMDYEVRLIDGTLCYTSEKEGAKTFLVGREELESGIHKAVQFLKRGDKAIVLIPSPLAHGLLGDFKKIPPQMPIVYDVHIH